MKTILKLGLFFVLVISMSSCSGNEDSLTEDYVLQYLGEKESLSPIVFKTSLPNIYITTVNDISNGINYYAQLESNGYLTTQLRTDIPNPSASNRPYRVVTTQASAPYILETKPNGTILLKTLGEKSTFSINS